jgi:hypothetical protein
MTEYLCEIFVGDGLNVCLYESFGDMQYCKVDIGESRESLTAGKLKYTLLCPR